MKKFFILIAVFAPLLALSQINGNCGLTTSKPRHYLKVTVDKINNNNNDGVSRVSCSLVGVPHTSSRIDSVTAVIGGRIYKATDIDGVDFERYFQWEEEGVVPVDVDIRRTNVFSKKDTLRFHTVHGVYSAPLKKK